MTVLLRGGVTSKSSPKLGFTLAEVLITLGIIGVVTAMTIPNLIANTRSSQYRSAFKKAVSTLSQAARMSEAQYGFDYAGINAKCGTNAATEHPEEVMTICAILNGTLTGATYVNKISDLQMKKGNSTISYDISSPYLLSLYSVEYIKNFHAYLLQDGSIFAFNHELGSSNGCTLPIGETLTNAYPAGGPSLPGCVGFIDVNGVNLPNIEVSCSSGSNLVQNNTCVVKNDAKHLTDIYPIRLHDGIVEPATASARYVLKTAK